MNRDQVQGKFEQIKGKVKEQWSRLTDDDVALLNSQREQFFGRLQELYGTSREEAERTVRDIERKAA